MLDRVEGPAVEVAQSAVRVAAAAVVSAGVVARTLAAVVARTLAVEVARTLAVEECRVGGLIGVVPEVDPIAGDTLIEGGTTAAPVARETCITTALRSTATTRCTIIVGGMRISLAATMHGVISCASERSTT
jgi:hypothetical protein